MSIRKSKTSLFLLLFFLSSSLIFSQNQKKLSLEDCILHAIKNNLSVAVEVLNPELAGTDVSKAREKFLPSLSLNFMKQSELSPSFSWLESADKKITKTNLYLAHINQSIPTGGTLFVSFTNFMTDTNTRFQSINPYFSSNLSWFSSILCG